MQLVMSRGDSIVAQSRFCQVNPLTSGCQASGRLESHRLLRTLHAVLRAQDVRTLSKIDLATNQLPACSDWRFNVIREWQICNACRFTIYRRCGYMMRRSSTCMQMRSGSSFTSTYYQSRKN